MNHLTMIIIIKEAQIQFSNVLTTNTFLQKVIRHNKTYGITGIQQELINKNRESKV